MIRLLVLPNLFATKPAQRFELPWRGNTAAELLQEARTLCPALGKQALAVCIKGKRLEVEQLPWIMGDNVELVIAPDPQGIDPLSIAIMIAISFAISFAYSKLVGRPKGLTEPAERGDQRSPTYAWDQIQSEWRQGFPVPLIFGLHDVGGQVIYADVFASAGGINIGAMEFLRVILAVGEGRIYSIGGVTGGTTGEEGGLGNRGLGGFVGQTEPAGGTICQDVRINGNRFDHTQQLPGVRMWVRMGEIAQTPVPSNPFRGVTSTLIVDEDLTEQGQTAIATISDSNPITTLAGVLAFPSGLYAQDSQGNLTPANATFTVDWRPQGEVSWRPGTIVNVLPSSYYLNAVSISWAFDPNRGGTVDGPLEVRMTRTTPSGQSLGIVSRANWRQVIYNLAIVFAYPRVALLAMEIAATEKTASGRPNFAIRTKGLMVKVYDPGVSASLSTQRFFELPTASSSYFGIWSYAPGRNPAWVLIEFLLNRAGLGAYISVGKIDLAAFRDWADFCDGDVDLGASSESRFQCNFVLDRPTSAWDVVLRICQAGRAMPVIRGDKISVKYEYAAGHGRGSNSVPAKTRTQLFTSSNVEECLVTYLNVSDRIAVYDFQILDEDKDYAQQIVPVADPFAGVDQVDALTPINFTREPIDNFGVTRRSQIIREGRFMHGVNRTIKSQIQFRVGPEALASEVGDVVGFQHEILRPYDSESFAFRLSAAVAAATTIRLDRAVTLAVATTYQIVIRETSGDITTATVTSVAGAYAAGAAITIDTTITAPKSAPLALGVENKVVKDYLLIGVSLAENVKLECQALEWHPSIYVDEDVATILDAERDVTLIVPSSVFNLSQALATVIASEDITVQPTMLPGKQVIQWALPQGYEASKARVWARLASASSSWWLLGEVKGTSLEWSFAAGQTYELAVTISDKLGTFQLPDNTETLTFTADEFPPLAMPSVRTAFAAKTQAGLALGWTRVDNPHLDYYEVRGGSYIAGATTIARTRETRLELPAPGRSGAFTVRARFRNGLYSERAKLIAGGDGAPSGGIDVAGLSGDGPFAPYDFTSYDVPIGMSLSGTSGIKLTSTNALRKAYTTDAGIFDIGYLATGLLVVTFETRQSDLVTCGDATWGCGSGEAHWRTCYGRDASPARPGFENTELCGDGTIPISDIDPDRLCYAYRGQPGFNTSVIVEARFDTDGDGVIDTGWQLYPAGFGIRRTFRDFDLRFTLQRVSRDFEVYFESLSVQVFQ